MGMGELRGIDDSLVIALSHAGDVVTDRTREQFDVLGEVADEAAELVGVPVCEISAVKADLTRGGLEEADQQPGERALARGRRSHDRQNLPRIDRQGDLAQDRAVAARRHVAHALDRQLALRGGQARPLRCGRQHEQPALQASVGDAGGREDLPGAHRLLNRRERAADQDGAGDHAAGRQLALDHQQRARAEDGDLHDEAERLGEADDCPRPPGRRLRGVERALVDTPPALHHGRQHAHCLNDLGVANCRLGLEVSADLRHVGLEQRLAGQ